MKKGFQNNFWNSGTAENDEKANAQTNRRKLPEDLSLLAEQSKFSKTLKSRLYSNRDEKLSQGGENISFSKVSIVQKAKDIRNDLFPTQKKTKTSSELDFLNRTDENIVNIRNDSPLNRINEQELKGAIIDRSIVKLKPLSGQSPRPMSEDGSTVKKTPMWFIGKCFQLPWFGIT